MRVISCLHFFLFLIVVALAGVAGGNAAMAFGQKRGAVECKPKIAPQVRVVPYKSNVRYDFSKSKAELNSFNVDTISPYGPRHKTTVSGLMSGAIKVEHRVSFVHETYDQVGQGCLYLKSVDVKVKIDPTIYIAREHKQGSCMHTAVLVHERKHVREDQLIVNKYTSILEKRMEAAVEAQGYAFGPYETARMPFVQENIQNALHRIVQHYNDEMNEERRERQQAIDNIEEYESIGARCDG